METSPYVITLRMNARVWFNLISRVVKVHLDLEVGFEKVTTRRNRNKAFNQDGAESSNQG